MFRNSYLQTYKLSFATNSSIESLLCHFNYVYVTLGSIIQDIEFQISVLIANQQSNKHTQNQPTNAQLKSSLKKINKPKEILDEMKKQTKANRLTEKLEKLQQKTKTKEEEPQLKKAQNLNELVPDKGNLIANQPGKRFQTQEIQNEHLDDLSDDDFMDRIFRKRK